MFRCKNLLPLFAACAIGEAFAMNLPSTPSHSGYDEIRLPDGTMCRTSMNGPQLQIGALGSQNGSDSNHYYDDRYGNQRQDRDEAGVYVQFSMPIGGPERIDCSKLYSLAVKEKELQLAELEARIKEVEARAKMAGLNLPVIQ